MKNTKNTKPSIVLVHGAFADASGWQKIILGLQARGFFVTAVQLPLKSLADDIATTVRVLQAQTGDVVLVGHSYGGAVITGAASPNVKALVYLSAFAPDGGESLGALIASYPPSSLSPAIVPDSAGFLYIDRSKFRDVFAGDVSEDELAVMSAAQKPIAAGIFSEPVTAAAWKTVPSWYIVASQDHAINPDLERFMARRMNAKTVELASSHVPFISMSSEVIQLIESAAATTKG